MPRLALFLSLLALCGCPTRGGGRGGDDDDATGDDDDATGDDDDVTGDDDDDATGDDDDATGDDDDATTGTPCDITLTLATGDASSCDASWVEQGVSLSFRQGTCGSGCSAEATSGGVWVYPAELRGDFSGLSCTVSTVTIEIVDWVGTGAADLVLYNGGGSVIDSATNTIVASAESIDLSAAGAVAFGVSGCETQVTRVRIR